MLTLKYLRDAHNLTFTIPAKDMQSLINSGIARELTGKHRNRVFVCDAYLLPNKGGQPL